jgi:2-(1,2-epoxy-1,2-dihydrophenyl)acetyl-CoA isomerase
MVSYDHIDYTVLENRAEIILDREELLNAFDDTTVTELNDAIERANDDDDVYAILLTGRGRGFCSGADVSNMNDEEETKEEANSHLLEVQRIVRQLHNGKKPTVAAVNGPAIGAGADFAFACDIRVMAEDAYFREQFVNIGLIPGDGGGWLLPKLVGESKAKEYVLTGQDIHSDEAEDVGLVANVVERNEVVEAAREITDTLVSKPRLAMEKAKELVDGTRSYDEYCRIARESQWECTHHPEHAEAIEALLDDRQPNFDR